MNDEITPEADDDAIPATGDDTEGHRQKRNHLSEAGEDDTEGHIGKRNHVTEAGDDDTEGHIGKRNH